MACFECHNFREEEEGGIHIIINVLDGEEQFRCVLNVTTERGRTRRHLHVLTTEEEEFRLVSNVKTQAGEDKQEENCIHKMILTTAENQKKSLGLI